MQDLLHSLSPRWFGYLLQVLRLCVWLCLLAVIFLPLERLFALHPSRILRKGVLLDLAYYFLSSLVPALLLGLPLSVLAWLTHHVLPPGYFVWTAHLPLLLKVLASFVVGEIGFYWGHRWTHEIPFLWGFHAIHHSAEHMDFLVNTRAHPMDVVFTRLCGLVPLYILGLAAPVRGAAGALPLLVVLAGTLWGFFIHSNLRWRLGFIEKLVATPAFHHWHHTNDSPDLLNRNYASMLPFMDSLFGTLYLPRDQHPGRYGIDQQLAPTLLGQLIEPFVPQRSPQSQASPAPEASQDNHA